MKPKIGQAVKFKDLNRASIWSLTNDVGTVTAVRQFGPVESMVTVKFAQGIVHTSDVDLTVLDWACSMD